MNARIAASSVHALLVQKVSPFSRNTAESVHPAVPVACLCDRNACHANGRKYCQDRSRNRVSEMNAMAPQMYRQEPEIL